jgi:hypothetical protein
MVTTIIIVIIIVVIIIFLIILLIFRASLLLSMATGLIRRLPIVLLASLIIKREWVTKGLQVPRRCRVNIKLLLNVVHPHYHLLLTLCASTIGSKHVLHEELELVGRLTTGGGG